MSYAGNKCMKRLIWMLSIMAIRMVPRSRAYFECQVEGAKPNCIFAGGQGTYAGGDGLSGSISPRFLTPRKTDITIILNSLAG